MYMAFQILIFFFFFEVMGFEIRAYAFETLPVLFCDGYFADRVLQNYFPRLASKHYPPDLCLLRS
jgi:hypothetical protein